MRTVIIGGKTVMMRILLYIRNYLYNVCVGISQILSVLSFGDPDETVSSRLGKAQKGMYGPFWKRVTKPLQVAVDFVIKKLLGKPNHCEVCIDLTVGNNDTWNRKEIY